MLNAGPADGKTPADFKKNTEIVLSFLWAWMAVIAVHALFYSLIRRQPLLDECRKLAWRTGILPSVRGKIIAADGRILAETAAKYDLLLLHNAGEQAFSRIKSAVENVLPRVKTAVYKKDRPVLLAENLVLHEIRQLQGLLKKYPGLRIRPTFRRIVRGSPDKIGKLDGKGHGISGLEQKYDAELSGTEGHFAVMLDRSGSWIPGSVRILRHPGHGKDIRMERER